VIRVYSYHSHSSCQSVIFLLEHAGELCAISLIEERKYNIKDRVTLVHSRLYTS
jgi:hypothetical protein